MIFGNPFLWFLETFEIRLIIGILLFGTKMPRRDHFYWRLLIFLPLLLVNPIFHWCGIDLFSILRVGWFSFIFPIEFLFGLGCVVFCYRLDYRRVLYVGTGAYSFQNAVNALYFFFLFRFRLFGQNWAILIYLAILGAFFNALYFGVFSRRWFVTSTRMDALPVVMAIAFSLGILMVYSSYLSFGMQPSPQIHMNQFLISGLIVVVLINIMRHNVRVSEKEILERLLIEKEKEYRITQESIALINQKSHDLKKIVRFLQENAQGDIREEANTVEEMIRKYDSVVQTGNDTVDICISEKKLYCLNNNINFSCMVDGKLLDGMSAVDIYTFLSNALDNAIEATMLIPEPSKRNIALSIARNGNMAQVRLENSYQVEPVFVSGLPITTKSNRKYHGFGVQSIRATIKKYGGFFDCGANNGKFVLLATLPL
ncbi:MAG: GHKL domain-containing protein [Bacilli bacterium]|nr:GHKL domain-containing protein [Bacilli bacterium]